MSLSRSPMCTQRDGFASCVHIGDREIYELFRLAQEQGTHFLERTCVDRLAGSGSTTIAKKIQRKPIRGTYVVEVLDQKRRLAEVKVHLRFCQMTVHPPIGKHREYPPLSLTVIHAREHGKPDAIGGDSQTDPLPSGG